MRIPDDIEQRDMPPGWIAYLEAGPGRESWQIVGRLPGGVILSVIGLGSREAASRRAWTEAGHGEPVGGWGRCGGCMEMAPLNIHNACPRCAYPCACDFC